MREREREGESLRAEFFTEISHNSSNCKKKLPDVWTTSMILSCKFSALELALKYFFYILCDHLEMLLVKNGSDVFCFSYDYENLWLHQRTSFPSTKLYIVWAIILIKQIILLCSYKHFFTYIQWNFRNITRFKHIIFTIDHQIS